MQIRVTFRHTDSTEALKSYASEKVDKVSKLLIKPTSADVVLSVEKKKRHKAEVILHALGGDVIKGVEVDEDMYSAIDKVVDKLTRQAKKIKEKVKTNARALKARYRVLAPEGSNVSVPGSPDITESEYMSAPPMSVEQAYDAIADEDREFIVFTNERTKAVTCLYKRFDGYYGLCQPNFEKQANGTVPFRFEVYEPADAELHFVRAKNVDVAPMTVDQSVSFMNESRNDFWVFTDEAKTHVNVVYRIPQDNGYGLIEAFATL